jgi:hypothetical protein
MKAGTPAALAPGVSVLGMIISEISATIFCCVSVKENEELLFWGEENASHLSIAMIVGAEKVPPNIKATFRMTSLLFIFNFKD